MLVSCPLLCMAGGVWFGGDIVPVRQVPAGPGDAMPYGIAAVRRHNGAQEGAPSSPAPSVSTQLSGNTRLPLRAELMLHDVSTSHQHYRKTEADNLSCEI
jgi:hypothetical protein